MVKHIVLWNFVEEMTAAERDIAGKRIKTLLEPIKELVPAAVDIQVILNGQPTGNRDIALLSTFETTEALAVYQSHPDHVAAGKYIRSVTCDRACMDFEF